MSKWRCPNDCDINSGVVCGGSLDGEDDTPNIYFFVDLNPLTYTKRVHAGIRRTLSDLEWKLLHAHADGGCCAEVMCPECYEVLENVE